jgi:opacity protein-like surface antigen
MVVALITALLAAGGQGRQAIASNPLRSFEMPVAADDRKGDREADPADDDRTPYVAGIVGASFASGAEDVAAGRLPMGDAAIGVSIPRPLGAVRLELEGRQRTALSGTRSVVNAPHDAVPVTIDGEWTTLANVWRDVGVGEHATVYAGAGAGVGGYRETSTANDAAASARVTDFGWQVGGGATYAVTDRVTLDAGYRYYGVGTGSAGRPVEPAGEVVFAVRIADPFRGWLRR